MISQYSSTITALKHNVLFQKLPLATLALLATDASTLNLLRGKQLHRHRGRCPGVYALVSGCLMLKVGPPESSKVMELVCAGEFFGLASTLAGVRDSASAQALADSTLLLIPRTTLLKCAIDTPQLALRLARALSRQVQNLVEDIEGYSLHSGRELVAGYLLKLAAVKGTPSNAFVLPAKKSIIASRLSLTPEYFSRTLHDLIAAGAIAVNGRQVTVLDASRLR